MATAITCDFTNVKLLDIVPGRVKFFERVMEHLQEAQDRALDEGRPGMSALILGRKIENVGGYFTNGKYVPRIVLPADIATYDEQNDTIQFADEKAFCVFVHEACHFIHLMLDDGRFTAKSLRDKEHSSLNNIKTYLDRNVVRDDEYEAGWRSLVYNNLYDLQAKDTIFELNRNNMMIYLDKPECAKKIRERIDKAYVESHNNMDKETWKAYVDEVINPTLDACQKEVNDANEAWYKTISKFSDIADYQNHLTLTAAQEKVIEDSLSLMESKLSTFKINNKNTQTLTTDDVDTDDKQDENNVKPNVSI